MLGNSAANSLGAGESSIASPGTEAPPRCGGGSSRSSNRRGSLAGAAVILAARSLTSGYYKLPFPLTVSTRPLLRSSSMARRTDSREAPNSATSSSSAGSRPSGG